MTRILNLCENYFYITIIKLYIFTQSVYVTYALLGHCHALPGLHTDLQCMGGRLSWNEGKIYSEKFSVERIYDGVWCQLFARCDNMSMGFSVWYVLGAR